MALLKKLMCFKTQANFETQLAAGEINDYSIVFIQDTQKIWTHQTYFGSTGDLSDYYTKNETYSKEEVDALIGEIENAINDLSDKVSELENSQVSVEAGDNVTVTKDGNVYTVSAEFDTSNLATKDELSDVSDKVDSNSSSIENLQEQITEIESGGVDLTNYYTKGETNDLLEEKQDILSAGDNISIANNKISATDTTYSAGSNVSISSSNVISVNLDDYATTSSLESGLAAKQDKITAGTGLAFDGDTLNCTIDDTLFVVVTSLPSAPAADDEHKIHLVPLSTTGTDNKYAEYLWVDGAWEKLGELTTSTDLSGYYTSAQIDSLLSDKQDKLTAGSNISISGNTISATDTTYTAGTNVSISSSNVISATDTDTGATSVSASGTSPLTLTGSYSSSNRRITITGSVDTYSKSEIDDKLSTATSGGLTDVTASGTSPLTLSASKSGSTVAISGSVDLSDYATTSSVNSSISTLTTSVDSKQDKLTAGDNITITGSTISATDTTYTAGTNVQISSSNVISATNTTYSNATTSTAGLMSASDKSTLDSISGAVTSVSASGTSPLTLSGSISSNALSISGSVANATASTAGVVKPYSVLSSAPSTNSPTTTSGRYYYVSTNSNNVMVVNVPWTDTTYTLSGLGGIDTVSASGTSPLTLSASKSGTSVTITGSVDTDTIATTVMNSMDRITDSDIDSLF